MTPRTIILGVTFLLSLILGVLGASEAAHLQRGYSIGVALGDDPVTVYHDAFPTWLKIGHAATALGAFGSLALCMMPRPSAVPVAWAAFIVATIVGIYDIIQYGTIGTPMSLEFYMLILGVSIFVTYLNRKGLLRS